MKTLIVLAAPALVAATAVWALGEHADGLPVAARAAIVATVVMAAILGTRKLVAVWSARQESATGRD
jgi:hypothetical protein